MKFSEPTKATLYALRRIAGDLLLIPPDQFALIGKDEPIARTGRKKRQHASLTARGTLLNTVEEEIGFSSFHTDQLRVGQPVSLSDNKIVSRACSFKAAPECELAAFRETLQALDTKLDAAPVCTFTIGKFRIIKSRKAIRAFVASSRRAAVVVRFYKEARGEPQCKLSLIADRWAKPAELTHSYSWLLEQFEGAPFDISMMADLYQLLPPSDYEVTVYSSGLVEWIAMDHRLTFVIENQKIMERWP